MIPGICMMRDVLGKFLNFKDMKEIGTVLKIEK